MVKIATLLGSSLNDTQKQVEELIEFERKLAKVYTS